MKIFKEKIEIFKTKRELKEQLRIYREFIFKKLESEELKSSINKARSALTLIKEHEGLFNLKEELEEFDEINQKITYELQKQRDIYVKRLYILLKEKIDETNLENLMKLLVKLKSEVDQKIDAYNLEDVQINIISYFKFIKKLYTILSSYEVVNYFEVSENIFQFIRDLEFEDFPNLSKYINTIYQKLITRQLFELSNQYEKISISELSEKLAITQEDLEELVMVIIEDSDGPIKVFNATTNEVLLRRRLKNQRTAHF